MTIEILDKAENDLVEGYLFYEAQQEGLGTYFEGYLFYEAQQEGLGTYFLESLYSDIESLRLYAGIHRVAYRDYHRLVSKRFPFAVFYTLADNAASVHAVVDSRRRPAWIREHLR